MQKFLRANRGFTVVEFMVAVMILGILVTLTFPSVINMIERARYSQVFANGRNFVQYLETYAIDANTSGTRTYPVSATEVLARGNFPSYNIVNPYYLGGSTSYTVSGQEIISTGGGEASTQVWVIETKADYENMLSSAGVINANAPGALMYYPYTQNPTTGQSEAIDDPADSVDGYTLNALDKDGRRLHVFPLEGGLPYVF